MRKLLRDYTIKHYRIFLTGSAYSPDAPCVAIPLIDSTTLNNNAPEAACVAIPLEDSATPNLDEHRPSQHYVRPLPAAPTADGCTYDTLEHEKETAAANSTADDTGAANQGKSEGNILLLLLRTT